jgi:hypothetical protein
MNRVMDRVRREPTPSRRSEPTLEEMENSLLIDGDDVDTADLDTALLKQPQLYWRVSRQVALTISRRDAAKQEVTSAMSRADHQIRKSIKQKGESTTETDIKSRVAMDLDVEKANKELSRLTLLASEWQAMESSFDQRMKALGKLVDLYLKNYFQNSGLTSAQGSMKSHNADLARRDMAEQRRGRRDS